MPLCTRAAGHTIFLVHKVKRLLLTALAAGLPAALQAQGQPEGGWYLGSGLVPPKPRPELRIVPHPSESRETLESSLQQFGGYRFTPNWSLDVGYTATSQSGAWTLAGSEVETPLG